MGPVLAAEAQARGVHVTVETCQHYLTRTAYDSDLDMRAKISPPLRDKEEQDGLWRGILNGSVYSLGTDHVPFLPKKLEDLWTELPGVVSFPWELPLMLHFGVHQRGLPLSRLVQLNSAHPARRFGLWPRKGNIEVGFDADLVLVDLDEERTVHHTGKGTCIYEGWKLKGWPVLTVARGAVIYENGQVDESRFGRGRCLSVPA
jgi:dihydropyrimidinase